MQNNPCVTDLEKLIETGERFIQELDIFDKNQPAESPLSIVNQKKLDKIYEQSLETLKELKSICRQTRQKLKFKNTDKPLKANLKPKSTPKEETLK